MVPSVMLSGACLKEYDIFEACLHMSLDLAGRLGVLSWKELLETQ